jgi:hypothetical protein
VVALRTEIEALPTLTTEDVRWRGGRPVNVSAVLAILASQEPHAAQPAAPETERLLRFRVVGGVMHEDPEGEWVRRADVLSEPFFSKDRLMLDTR